MKRICKLFGYSKAGYYKHLSYQKKQSVLEAKVLEKVHEYRTEMPEMGGRKIWHQLLRDGIKIGRDHLFKLLGENYLLVISRPKYVVTSISGTMAAKPNLMKNRVLTHVNEAWGTDITYIATREGVMYLHVILDLYSRRVMGWHFSADMTSESVLVAFEQAKQEVAVIKGIIFHSDQGKYYLSAKVQKELEINGMLASNTGDNHCYDNAIVERFHKTLKYEFGLRKKYLSKAETRDKIAMAMHIYNTKRLHASLNYQTPMEMYNAA